MPHLTDMDVSKVSLVPRGANGRRLAVVKSADDVDTEKRSLLAKVAGLFGYSLADVEKAETTTDAPEDDMPEAITKAQQTFATLVAGQQLTDALEDQFWTLKDALWQGIYAYEGGELLPMPDRQALVAQSLDEFKAYLLGQMDTGIAKADEPMPDPLAGGLDAVVTAVRKVGKKISSARLERLKSAADALAAVLAEVEVSDEDSDEVEKRADAQGDDDVALTDEDIQKVAAAIEPRLAAIEKRLPAEVKEQPAAAAGDTSTEDEVPEPVAKAFTAIIDRLDVIEKAASRGTRTSIEGQDSQVKKGSFWNGVL